MSAKQIIQEITFDDLADLTDREIQLVLREVDTKDLAVALKGARRELKDRIFDNMSERVGAMIREEVEFSGSLPARDAERVQEHIADVMKQLQKAGQILRPVTTKKVSGRKPKLSKEYLDKKQVISALVKRPLDELDLNEIDRMFVGLAEVARREGIMALDKMIQRSSDAFLSAAIRLAVDGTEPELIQNILGAWVVSLLHEQDVKYRKILEGILSIQSGDNPRIVEQKLNVLY